MDTELTPRERKYLNFIKAYKDAHGGIGPLYRDYREVLGDPTTSVQSALVQLREKGYVHWPKRDVRRITVLK